LMPSLEKIGFEISIDKATNRIEILAIPSILTNLKIKEFLHNLINVLDESITVETLLYERICQTACKAAIKGGDGFSEEQLEYLLKTLTKNDLPTRCPHGRPAIIEIKKQSLEKLFKRVL
ncbi:MAG: DNA mismatch repair protein MutL, partial [Eubacteriales bacterium]|nr:DNA mismatch repair protein MutL [Eubacteriales bacterium]